MNHPNYNKQLYYLVASIFCHCISIVFSTTSSVYYTGVVPASVTVGVNTNVRLDGTTRAGDLIAFSKNCSLTDPFFPPPLGVHIITKFLAEETGEYFLCVRSKGNYDGVQQTGISISSISPTLNNTVKAVVPSVASAHSTVLFHFERDSNARIRYGFVRVGSECTVNNLPDSSPINEASFTKELKFSEAGDYVLCAKLQAGSDVIEQSGGNTNITILPPTGEFIANNVSPKT